MEEGRVERSHGYDLRSSRHQEQGSSQVSRISENPVHDANSIHAELTLQATYHAMTLLISITLEPGQ